MQSHKLHQEYQHVRRMSDFRVAASRSGAPTLLKICGVTSAEDALMAAEAGADLIGMIMWPKAKRSVSDAVAMQIANVAKQHGAQPVGVFVDESADLIVERCDRAGITVAQLHGDGARAALLGLQGKHLQIVYVMHATPDGQLVTSPPPPSSCDWVLVDGLQGGSGQALDWTQLQPPTGVARCGWLLAGGLQPDNVSTAVRLAHPTGVDVSSGVCGPDGLEKDRTKVSQFAQAVREAVTDPAVA
eukprot:CAMPEP_0119105080 /NCGR_PEP_ID=MMETSP1180-20130426/3136_1 /TAXON_ID=3052 ORGANISM="Chlamydomonas cf sp, Strain CCMP681" /NCGR_SAMPLE_ID=MMETSP1180 /ASSEMBLY_ACC=CAM_ASM_000741 /LENGTH=243 /DNA_ID=CAMNT_0007090037 /DNA_START=266 /DNA_END=997 /DNA_ORIENTATION=-